MAASMDFIHLMKRATDVMTDYMAKNDERVHAYIVIGLEEADISRASSCANISPEQMYQVMMILVENSRPWDVSDKTQTH